MPKKIPEFSHVSTVIIGAGPAGLATAACLTRAQKSFAILEKNNRIGSSWHKHYDRLHLNTDKYCSALPHLPFPATYPKYPSRKDVIAYLEAYARHFELTPHLEEPVLKARRQDEHWITQTPVRTYTSTNLVIASGNNQHPSRPHWHGQEAFQGEILHSIDYKNGRVYKGQNVLVVGIGNTGGEIAMELAENGARVTISIRGPVNILPRDILGIPILKTIMRLTRMPMAFTDQVRSGLFRVFCYNLPEYGLTRPPYDPITQTNRFGKLPLIDKGTVALIKKGKIKIRPGVASFNPTGVTFKDGSQSQFDTIILATGYRPRLDAFLDVDKGLLDKDGRPRNRSCITGIPGLYFCGFTISYGGILSAIGEEAIQICQHIIDNSA
jgi:cation diffusion facilitator CzcD-associated flavoprotein CzcO